MQFDINKKFQKSYTKLSSREQRRVDEAILLFLRNPESRKLRLHELKGELSGVWSINVGGDLRIHFEYTSENSILLINIGTHSQLYK